MRTAGSPSDRGPAVLVLLDSRFVTLWFLVVEERASGLLGNTARRTPRRAGKQDRPASVGTPDETATFTEQGLAHLLTNTTTGNQTVSAGNLIGGGMASADFGAALG